MLTKNGVTPEEAEQMVGSLGGAIRGRRTSAGLGAILVGLLMMGAGVGASLWSLSTSEASAVLYWGAVVAGLISIGKGLHQLLG